MAQERISAEAFHPDQFSKSEYAQLVEVIEACDVGLCILDQQLRVLAWNRRLAEIVGKKSVAVLGRSIERILPSLGTPQFAKLVNKVSQPVDDHESALTPGDSGTRQHFRGDDGRLKRASVRPLVMHPGCCLVQISDMGPELSLPGQSENGLIAEQRSLAMLSSVEDAVILLDSEGCIEFANLAAEGMTGYQNRDIAGRPLQEIYQVFDESSDARVRLSFEEIVSIDNRILLMMHREGLTFPIEQSISRFKDDQGRDVGTVLVFKDVSQSRKLAAQLNWQASHDPITRLYNRTEFDRRLSQLLEEAEVEGTKHCLLYLDIDRFKVVNDTCGHVAGDELLRQVGSIIKHAIRSSDLLARVGGDEFAILLSSCELDVALRIADAIRLEFQRFRFAWEDKTFSQSVSIGLVSIDSASEGLQQVLSFADTACYAAKEAGRDQIHVYHPEKSMAAVRHGEAQWVTRIRSALEEDRFTLYVQPILGLGEKHNGQQHYEVLIRMIDESGDLIPPGAFIPAAERYDLMPSIDRWVIGHLIDRLVENGSCDGGKLRMFVNLSGHSLCDEQTLQMILDRIRHYELPDGLLCFEVTETAAISNLSSAKRFMQALKRFGCEFALDDFGSGLSSFGYLKHLPVEYLKIDGSFVKDMIDDRIDESMVDAINRIGHIMELETIAECVESEDILQRLIGMGVDFAQGYGIRHPFPLAEMFKENS